MEIRPGPWPGFRPGFLSFIDPHLRERVGQIYAEYFAPEEEKVYAQGLRRIQRLVCWITAPDGRVAAGVRTGCR